MRTVTLRLRSHYQAADDDTQARTAGLRIADHGTIVCCLPHLPNHIVETLQGMLWSVDDGQNDIFMLGGLGNADAQDEKAATKFVSDQSLVRHLIWSVDGR